MLNTLKNRFEQGSSNQQFVITSANNLANDLSNLLEQLQNASMQMGKGKGDGRQEFTLPDIIQTTPPPCQRHLRTKAAAVIFDRKDQIIFAQLKNNL